MYPITYSHSFQYRPLMYLGLDGQVCFTSDLPALEVILRRNGVEYPCLALIDTGATFSLFSRQIGEVLGLSLPDGRREQLATLGGASTAYAHTVELEIANGWSLRPIEVLFCEEDIQRNLLGRSDFLLHVQLGLWEYTGTIYLKKASL